MCVKFQAAAREAVPVHLRPAEESLREVHPAVVEVSRGGDAQPHGHAARLDGAKRDQRAPVEAIQAHPPQHKVLGVSARPPIL